MSKLIEGDVPLTISAMKPVIPILGLVFAALACGPAALTATPPASPTSAEAGLSPAPTITPVATATPPTPTADPLAALIEAVSAERLYGDVQALAAIPTRHVNSATIGQAAATIYDRFAAAGGGLIVAYDEFPLNWNGVATAQRNVIAALPGSDPSAGIVLVGAHYDSRSVDINDATSPAPGADDNATGVAVVMELARLLANETPRATVVFAAFSAEEVGKVGSTHYVQATLARDETFRAVIVLDIVGNSAGPQGEGAIRAFSAGPEGSPSRNLARFVAAQAATYVPGFEVLVQDAADRPHRYSDHVPFSDAGFAAIRLIEPVEDTSRNHSALDTPDRLSPTYLAQVARLVLVSVYNLSADSLPLP